MSTLILQYSRYLVSGHKYNRYNLQNIHFANPQSTEEVRYWWLRQYRLFVRLVNATRQLGKHLKANERHCLKRLHTFYKLDFHAVHVYYMIRVEAQYMQI